MTVAQLENEMPSSELSEWAEYIQIEPFESQLNAFYFAQLTQLLANINRDPKRAAFKLTDFLYKNPEQVEAEKTAELKAMFDTMAKRK